jgi:hypothetical protein
MKLTDKQLLWIGIGVISVIIIYANRGNLPLTKESLNADANGNNAIDKAVALLKSGQIKVNEMPENVKQQLNEV